MQRRQITNFPTNFNKLYVWEKFATFIELYNGYERTQQLWFALKTSAALDDRK